MPISVSFKTHAPQREIATRGQCIDVIPGDSHRHHAKRRFFPSTETPRIRLCSVALDPELSEWGPMHIYLGAPPFFLGDMTFCGIDSETVRSMLVRVCDIVPGFCLCRRIMTGSTGYAIGRLGEDACWPPNFKGPAVLGSGCGWTSSSAFWGH